MAAMVSNTSLLEQMTLQILLISCKRFWETSTERMCKDGEVKDKAVIFSLLSPKHPIDTR